ncbi:nucleoside recognition domain-containing protein [Desulforamulus putei]|uniref:Nucleoside recognition n=1 Tax=Desulforamulus putei DSM 12395 TaxID=1121429 RepID=A0A1M4WWS3_9FIRM|nr:nucleoside recognition domain-containing protein [Desulforamulus putei]SHE85679.1 Nucleoside recognition [Desulforamulus putei DSM 12395]
MDWSEFARAAAAGSLQSVWQMALIIIPLMVILEIARDLKILNRIAGWMAPGMKIFRLPKEGAFPLLIGLTFGLAYGAGVIIESVKNGQLSWRDLFLINVFLILCHSVVEDTALFIAVGADGAVILISRIALALVVTFLLSRWSGLTRLEKLLGGKMIVPRCTHCRKG